MATENGFSGGDTAMSDRERESGGQEAARKPGERIRGDKGAREKGNVPGLEAALKIGDRIRGHKGVADREPVEEANVGNVSGLGGRGGGARASLLARRRSSGASIINLMPGLADTTRGSLFGL
jgi:hypothetical protein